MDEVDKTNYFTLKKILLKYNISIIHILEACQIVLLFHKRTLSFVICFQLFIYSCQLTILLYTLTFIARILVSIGIAQLCKNINLDIKVTVIASDKDNVFCSAVGIGGCGRNWRRIYRCASILRMSFNQHTLKEKEQKRKKLVTYMHMQILFICSYFINWSKLQVEIHYPESVFWQSRAEESRQILKQHGGHVTVMLHRIENRPLAAAVSSHYKAINCFTL